MTPRSFKPLLVTLGLVLAPACTSSVLLLTESTGTGAPSSTDADTASDPTTTSSTTAAPATTTSPTDDSTTSADTTLGDTTLGDTTDSAEGRCDRLGGFDGVRELVDVFVSTLRRDDRLNGYFLNQGLDTYTFGMDLGAQVGALVGCDGVVYNGRTMKAAHAGMGISAQDFLDFIEDFNAALNLHADTHPDLTEADSSWLLTELRALEDAIVEDPDNNLSVYQRIGRKPAIEKLVGTENAPNSLIGRLLADDAINTYFTLTMLDRFGTCMTRQLAAIDGPIQYGAEVDPPAPGVDVGVSGSKPCRAMGLVHDNLQDAAMTYITVDDFGAVITDLTAAMTSAGVAAPDREIVLDALGPLCEQIVISSEEKNKCPGNRKQAHAELTGLDQEIPDGAYDGTLASMRCDDIVVPADPDGVERVADLELRLGLDHPYIGELTVKVQSPGGQILTVLSRPGKTLMQDDGLGCCNDSSDLSKAYPITFKDAGIHDAAAMGSTLAVAQVVCKDDLWCEYRPNPSAGPGIAFTDFLDETAAGVWKVCVGDSTDGDIGTLDSIRLDFTKTKFNPKT